jgi:hypothetical protein
MDTIVLFAILVCLIILLRKISALAKGQRPLSTAAASSGEEATTGLSTISGQLAYLVSATWAKDERFREDLTEDVELNWSNDGYKRWDALVKHYGVWDRQRDYDEGGLRTLRGQPTRLDGFYQLHMPDRWPKMREQRWTLRREHVEQCLARRIKPQPFLGTGVDPAFDLLRDASREFWTAVDGRPPYGPHAAVEALGNTNAVALLAAAIHARLDKTSKNYLAVFAGERGEGTGLAWAAGRAAKDKMSVEWEAHVCFDIFLGEVDTLADKIGDELALMQSVQDVGKECDLAPSDTALVVLDLTRTWAAGLRFAGWVLLMNYLQDVRAAA